MIYNKPTLSVLGSVAQHTLATSIVPPTLKCLGDGDNLTQITRTETDTDGNCATV